MTITRPHLMTAAEIAQRAGGEVVGDPGAAVDAWAFDSRALGDGACFVALRGTRNGHDFVPAAFEAGARVAVVDEELPPTFVLRPGRALVRVADALVALQAVARAARAGRRDLHVVAVAGSTGKTSTKDLLAAALVSRGCHANAESYNNEFGLPITLLNAPASAHVVVTEMGERFPGDLALLCDIAQPDVGVITNVGLAHAEHLGGHDGTVAVLSELLDALPAEGLAVLPATDPFLPRLAAATRARVVTVGADARADVVVEDVRVDERIRPSFRIRGQDFTVPLHGAHHAENAALAIAVACTAFDLPLGDIAMQLAGATSARWRMELLDTDDGVTVLNDAYNANPTSMRAALSALAHLDVAPGARRIAVLGDMRELGRHHDDAHHEIGAWAAELGIDVVVGVGAGGRMIVDATSAGGAAVHAVANAGDAVHIVSSMVRPGDAVLVKGSRALALEQVADDLLARGRQLGAQGGAA